MTKNIYVIYMRDSTSVWDFFLSVSGYFVCLIAIDSSGIIIHATLSVWDVVFFTECVGLACFLKCKRVVGFVLLKSADLLIDNWTARLTLNDALISWVR